MTQFKNKTLRNAVVYTNEKVYFPNENNLAATMHAILTIVDPVKLDETLFNGQGFMGHNLQTTLATVQERLNELSEKNVEFTDQFFEDAGLQLEHVRIS